MVHYNTTNTLCNIDLFNYLLTSVSKESILDRNLIIMMLRLVSISNKFTVNVEGCLISAEILSITVGFSIYINP